MNLRQEILKEHSKAQCTRIVQWVGSNQQRFDELFRLFLHDEYQVVQRAAWPLSYCVIAHPSFISKHWKKLLGNLKKPNLHDAVKRNSIRLMQDVNIPEKYHGEVMHICFGYLESPTEPLAVKCFSMTLAPRATAATETSMPQVWSEYPTGTLNLLTIACMANKLTS